MTRLQTNSVVENIPKTKIFIPKGTPFYTSHPQKHNFEHITKKSMSVCSPCKISETEENYSWAGSGGYWCWTKKTNVFFKD